MVATLNVYGTERLQDADQIEFRGNEMNFIIRLSIRGRQYLITLIQVCVYLSLQLVLFSMKW